MAKACWMVKLPGRRPFAMVGGVMEKAEAERAARVIWPGATVQ